MNTMFDYEPLNEVEVMQLRYQLLPEGTYDATIFKAESKVSKTNKNMLVLQLNVYTPEGSIKSITDYVVLIPTMLWKFRHLCQAADILKEYTEKTFTPDMLEGKNIKIKIKTQAGAEIPMDKLNGKPPGTCYPAKNTIEDYMFTAAKEVRHTSEPSNDFNDDLDF